MKIDEDAITRELKEAGADEVVIKYFDAGTQIGIGAGIRYPSGNWWRTAERAQVYQGWAPDLDIGNLKERMAKYGPHAMSQEEWRTMKATSAKREELQKALVEYAREGVSKPVSEDVLHEIDAFLVRIDRARVAQQA